MQEKKVKHRAEYMMREIYTAIICLATIALYNISAHQAKAENTQIKVCAHPKGSEKNCRTVKIEVMQGGFPMKLPQAPRQGENKQYMITLPTCDSNVTIRAGSSDYYYGTATCRYEPQPIQIAMSGDRWEVIEAAFTPTEVDDQFAFLKAVPKFDWESFRNEINGTSDAIIDLPEEAQTSEANLYAALAEKNYAEAQKFASELAAYLRQDGEEKLALAYSSITYVSGFRAIGIDALAEENPLLTTSTEAKSSFVVMNEEGQKVLRKYQELQDVPGKRGVWDFATTTVVSDTPITMQEAEIEAGDFIRAVPMDWETQAVSIDDLGRMRIGG